MIRALARMIGAVLRLVFWTMVAVLLILAAPWLFASFVIAVGVVGILAIVLSILVVVAWRRV